MEQRPKNILKKWIKGYLRDLYWQFYGNIIRNPELPNSPRTFLFVCKGNICRSPFAESLAKRISENNGVQGVTLFSAGLQVLEPESPPKEAIVAAESFGVCLNGFKSRSIDYDMIESFAMIIAMETKHLRILRGCFPQFKSKLFLLPLFEKNVTKQEGIYAQYNIIDPYGKDVDQFHTCYKRIERSLKGLFSEIEHRTRQATYKEEDNKPDA